MEHVLLKRQETVADMQLGPRRDFWMMVEQLQREHPELTNLEAFGLVRLTPRGKNLYEQAYGKSELLAPLMRDVDWQLGKRGERVTIRKGAADPGAMTGRDVAGATLIAIQKRHEAAGLNSDAAWRATLADPEGRQAAASYKSPTAHLTALEALESVRESLTEVTKDLEQISAGRPHDLHAAIVEVQKRDGVDYLDALQRATSDPANAALVERYQRERA